MTAAACSSWPTSPTGGLRTTYEAPGFWNFDDANLAINCADAERITDRAQVAAFGEQLVEAAPYLDSGRGVVAALDVCAFWPGEPADPPHLANVHGLPPTLVVSVTGDPNTPYQAGVNLAAELGARLNSVEGHQHTVALKGHDCVDRVVIDYLVNLTAPPGPTNCTI